MKAYNICLFAVLDYLPGDEVWQRRMENFQDLQSPQRGAAKKRTVEFLEALEPLNATIDVIPCDTLLPAIGVLADYTQYHGSLTMKFMVRATEGKMCSKMNCLVRRGSGLFGCWFRSLQTIGRGMRCPAVQEEGSIVSWNVS
jgi:hypothetical protein